MKGHGFGNLYSGSQVVGDLIELLRGGGKTTRGRAIVKGVVGSAKSYILEDTFRSLKRSMLYVAKDKESAAYILNDLEEFYNERELRFDKRRVLFFPDSYKKPYHYDEIDNANVLSRAEVLTKICNTEGNYIVITYPEALSEKVISRKSLKQNTLLMFAGEAVSHDFLIETLYEYNFQLSDFVIEPGQFSIRGGILDVFSFSNDLPYRIEFIGDEIESIRSFDPSTQLSVEKFDKVSIIPNIQLSEVAEVRNPFLDFLKNSTTVWVEKLDYCIEIVDRDFHHAVDEFERLSKDGGVIKHLRPEELYCTREEFLRKILELDIVEVSQGGNGSSFMSQGRVFEFSMTQQPIFNKNFDLLFQNIIDSNEKGIEVAIACGNEKQRSRLTSIFEELSNKYINTLHPFIMPEIFILSLFEGFVDLGLKHAIYTDHQIFERFHRFKVRDNSLAKESLTLKELYGLQVGDYVTHIDHGVGRFDGLETIDNGGRLHENIRIIYKNGDLLYVNIHSLHRIAKYVGKDGTPPEVNKLGSPAWQNTKARTKQRVKDIAKDLIQLYAKRKASEGFAFSSDSYLQNELEASFIYEDTPDQVKATMDIKKDMELLSPMDRLICGDVGFGKTELAIRAAFKAVADSKQVVVLVPTTILALQHYNTFIDRLKGLPVNVAYINRFVSAKRKQAIIEEVRNGRIDILIGTQSVLNKDLEFKNLGLLVVDEEHKFGVAVKEKLRQLKANIDTLTLTATPIPRTLQFSLLGARDLSVLNTPPANRRPVETELCTFSETVIRDAIRYELSRGGQVYFVHNRIDNIKDVAGMIQKFVPDARIAIAHGRLDGSKLEDIMIDFIDGAYDVLLSTTIVESGLDIPNANTMIINEAQNFGLSDLHQLRGRVGRSNKKAFCYLLTPPLSILSEDSRKRLRAIEEFSNLGSGFNIAMRDLDIRGAGNLLGGEQSGFISDIGYEMYQRILNEAIAELKNGEFAGLYDDVEPARNKEYVREVQFDTDLEVMFPVDYIRVSMERLNLYKELDNIQDEQSLELFVEKLIDRFGPMPIVAQELINVVRVRLISKGLGFEKVVLKGNKMICGFITNEDSEYFNSVIFGGILKYATNNPRNCKLNEQNNKLTFVVNDVKSVNDAIGLLRTMEMSN